MSIRTISLVVAMSEEVQPIVRALDLKPCDAPFGFRLPMQAWEARSKQGRVTLVSAGTDRRRKDVSNIGTQAATLAAYLAISTFKPDVLISAGAAGGFAAQGAEVGDVYLSRGVFRFHDRIIPLDGYDSYGEGGYPSADVSRVAVDHGLKLGEVSTGNSLRTLDSDWEAFERHRPAVKEMEAASVAWVAQITGTPMFAIKAIVDIVDAEASTEEQFAANLDGAVERLAEETARVVKYCLGAELSDLAAG